MAIDAKMVTIGTFKHYAMSGFLISYASDLVDSYRRAAAYVDKILNGAKPGDLPIDEATKFQVVLNLKTAANLGLNIPQSILIRANEVIE
jgi:putative ABC transport system substrate-binding protein